MKWVLSQQSPSHHKWLLQNAQEQFQLTYHLHHHSIRISGKSNRLFFLEITGVFQKRIHLQSEYGVVVGESNWPSSKDGSLIMNGQKMFFQWNEASLSLLDKNKMPLISIAIDHSEEMEKLESFALLFSSVWLLYADANKKPEDRLVA